MTYNEALNFIKNKESLGIKPGLVRIKEVLKRLDNPQDSFKTIHIAGTNGKGTIASTISKALYDSGLNVGLFTSPWVTEYREQIQLNGEMISEGEFADVIEEISLLNSDCTEFECVTVAAYLFFRNHNVDYAVIECGMGGRDDATNTEKNNLSVITSIALDHTDFLGSTVAEIAENKAGILRTNCPCVLYNRELKDIFEDKCSSLVLCPRKSNLALVNTVLDLLKLKPVKRLVKLPARMEIIGEVMLDGSHNVSAAKKLAPYLENETAVIAMLKDKDVEGYIKLIAPKCKTIIATAVSHKRAMPPEVIADIAEDYCDNVLVVDNPADAVNIKNLSLVCGSFYLAREVRKILLNNI